MTETAQALEPAFAHVALSVSDLHRSVAFYCDGLGFSAGDTYVSAGRRVAELMGIPPTGFAGVFLRCGPVHIELLEYRNAVASREGPPDPRAIGYAHVSVVVASVDDAVAGAIAHGGRRCAQLDHAFGGKCPTRIAFVTDPDHNRVELIEHPDAEERRAHAAFLGSRDQRWPPRPRRPRSGGFMRFDWSEADAEFRSALRDFVADELPPRWQDLIPGAEPASQFIVDFCHKLGERGWLTPHWPAEYGGTEASAWQFIILGEELWSAGEPRGSQYMNVNWIGPAIINAGTPEQRAYHLRRISAGDVFWCQGFSEMDAGTDLASMQTTAVRDGDDYVINGEKVWTSYAAEADFCFLLARTDPDSQGNTGISVFLVPTDTPGFTIEPIPSVLDIHEYNRLTFDNVRVSATVRLGPENHGWQVVREALSHERIGGPRYARAALVTQRLRDLAGERGWWERDGVKTRLADAEAACEAARILVYQAIDARAKGRSEDLAVNLARVAIVRCERIVAELALELFEGESLELGSVGNSQLKTSMIAGLGGGSVEVQLNGIARSLLGPNER